jgi:hypothetical protein
MLRPCPIRPSRPAASRRPGPSKSPTTNCGDNASSCTTPTGRRLPSSFARMSPRGFRECDQAPAARPADDPTADAGIGSMAAEMKAIDHAAKALQIRTKSQTVSLAPIFALTAATRMHRRGIGYYPTAQPAPADNRPITAEQAETLKRLAKAAYELDAFKPNLARAEADLRIAALTAKLKLLDGPPHTL